MSSNRTTRQRKLSFKTLDLAADRELIERGLELVARLLLERWQAKNTEQASEMEKGR